MPLQSVDFVENRHNPERLSRNSPAFDALVAWLRASRSEVLAGAFLANGLVMLGFIRAAEQHVAEARPLPRGSGSC